MTKWYLNYNGDIIGPLDQGEAVFKTKMNPGGKARRDSESQWTPIAHISELGGTPPSPSPPPRTAPKPVDSDEIDYQILGAEMQFVEIELDPDESAVAEAGAMMYKDSHIRMDTVFGDGSKSASKSGGGFLNKLVGAGKRLLTGESLFMTVFTHTGQGKAHVAFGAPYPGNIVPANLAELGGCLICQKDSFLCAAKGVSIGIHLQRKILTGLFGGEGFIMQKLEGDGMAFMHAGGTVVERTLNSNEILHVDTGCVVAYQPQVNFEICQAGGIKTSLFGGEGLFFAELKGPGRIWLQSLPFSRLAGRMLQSAPSQGGSRGEGSILGGLGNLIDGDNAF